MTNQHLETKLRRVIRRQARQIEMDRLAILRLSQQLADAHLERKRLKGLVLDLQERAACEDIHEYIGRMESRYE